MTFSGKNAPGLTGFPTPDEAAGTNKYLLFYIPDPTWSQYILGATQELTYTWNWYESGTLMPDEAADAFRLIVEQAPTNKLPSCSLPTGEPLMRINPENGKIQDVSDTGNWQDNPLIPSTPARPVAPPADQKCLAAANAANALKILYENLTDSFSGGLSTAEAATAFAVAVGEGIAAAFFPPAAALIAAGGAIFGVLYEIVGFVTADVWDTAFTDVLQCYLYDCATVDANVVKFEWHCVIDKMAAQTGILDLTADQIRLFGQIYYMLSYIGDDGLNYAGSATAVPTAVCACEWCYKIDLTIGDGGFSADVGTYDGGWVEGFVNGAGCDTDATYTYVDIHKLLPAGTYNKIFFTIQLTKGVFCSENTNSMYDAATGGTVLQSVAADIQSDGIHPFTWTGTELNPSAIRLVWVCGEQAGTDNPGGHIKVLSVQFQGTGDNPFGMDNC